MNADRYLRELYLDYVNNWLTVDSFAGHHNMSNVEMTAILKIARQLHENHCELAKSLINELLAG